MRILCAALSSAGFLLPTVAVARELAARGHAVRVVTDRSQAGTLAHWNLERIPRGGHDGPSFGVPQWAEPLHVAMQYAHLEYAVERFTPDVVLASHLTLGPVAFCTRRRLPLVIVGPIAYLWPLAGPSTDIDAPRARTAAWRYAEFRSFYRAACNELRLAFDESLLLGDRYLLQSVPILDPQIAPLLPPGVREVGACTLESPTAATDEVETWIEEHRTAGRPVAFVQLGRTFGVGDPWPAIAGWAAAEGVALFASLERYDAPVAAANGHVIIRNGIAFDRIVPQVDVVICSGTPSPLLAAALAGKPALIATSGSGSEEHAALFTRYGAALSFSAATVDPQHIAQLAQRIRIEPLFAQRAQALRNAYREFGGPQLAADEVEIAAGVAA